jgi:hypothetical protein
MVDLVAEEIPWLFSSIVVKRASIDGHRDMLLRFLKASIEGNYLALADEARAKVVLAKQARITDPKILDTSYNDFRQQSPANLEASRLGAQNIIDQFPAIKSRIVDDCVHIMLLEHLRKEDFFGATERKYTRR